MRMTRKIIPYISIFVIILVCLFDNNIMLVRAEVYDSSTGFYYNLNNNGSTVSINGIKKEKVKDIIIPDKINGKIVESIENNAFARCSNTVNVSISENVKSIGDSAFNGCTNLKTLFIPKNVIYIGDLAFGGCMNLESISVDQRNKIYDSRNGCNAIIRTSDNTLIRGCNKTVIPQSVVSIGDSAFSTSKFTEIIIPQNVKSIGNNAFWGCVNLTNIMIPANVTSIADTAFLLCNNVTITCTKDSYAYQYAVANNIPVNIMNVTQPVVDTGAINKTITIDSAGHSENFYFTPDMVSGDSINYNHELAKYSANLCLLAAEGGIKNRINGLSEMGFETSGSGYYYYDYNGKSQNNGAEAKFSITKKKIYIDNQQYNFVVVMVDGTYGNEWITNFKPGMDETHEYFKQGANFVYNKLTKYWNDNKLGSNTILLITGHSRGAAVSNLTASIMICNSAAYGLSPKNIYTYTFATPNNTRNPSCNDSKYDRIFNIINPEDFVTKVMPGQWKFNRYGITYVLPSKLNTRNDMWNIVYSDVKRITLNRYGLDYSAYILGETTVDDIVSYISRFANNQDTYKNKLYFPYYSFETYFSKGIAPLLTGCAKTTETVLSVTIVGASINTIYMPVTAFLLYNNGVRYIINDNFNDAHNMKTYAAFMNSTYITKSDIQSRKAYTVSRINCPVDVAVYDSDGTLVGEIKDNIVNESIDGIVMTVDGESKCCYMPAEEAYQIVVTGNDNGTMNVSVDEYVSDTGIVARANYSDIVVSDGQQWTIDKVEETSDVTEVIFTDIDNSTILTSEPIINTTDMNNLFVDITVEGHGYAISQTNLTNGDYVTLDASTDENNKFLGWYDGEDIVSEDANYSFVIDESLELTAKFTDVIVDVQKLSFKSETIAINVGDVETLELVYTPTNATKQKLTYSSSKSLVATVNEFGIVEGVSDGVTIVTASTEDGKIQGTIRIEVGNIEQEMEQETPQTEVPKYYPRVNISYRTHIQSYGWEGNATDIKTWKSNGAMSGTSGKAKRLEGINIVVNSAESGKDVDLGIQYTTHCQSYGWLPWSADGDMNGTEGEAKRLEAIKIQLTGADKDAYDVYYRVHAQSYGWLGWAKNGEASGTAGYSKRLEGIQILVVKKGEKINEKIGGIESKRTEAYIAKDGNSPVLNNTATSNKNPVVPGNNTPNVVYRTHVQKYGWQGWKYNGQMSGTSGEAKRLEGIEIKLTNKLYEGGIVYTTHVQKYGWQGKVDDQSTWKANGAMAGTSGEAKRLEAICINLTGEMAEHYDVYYRVHAQTFGWLGWANNGEESGTAGYAKRLEGIQVVLVPKGGAAPANNYGGITSKNSNPYISK